jgi:hypothetical protein
MSDPRLLGGAQKTIEDLLVVLEQLESKVKGTESKVKGALAERDAKIERLRALVDAAKGVTEYGEVAFMGVNIPFKSFRKLKEALSTLENSDE